MDQDHDSFVHGACTHAEPPHLNRWDGVLNSNIPFASMHGTVMKVNASMEQPHTSRHDTLHIVHTPQTPKSGDVSSDLRTACTAVVRANI